MRSAAPKKFTNGWKQQVLSPRNECLFRGGRLRTPRRCGVFDSVGPRLLLSKSTQSPHPEMLLLDVILSNGVAGARDLTRIRRYPVACTGMRTLPTARWIHPPHQADSVVGFPRRASPSSR